MSTIHKTYNMGLHSALPRKQEFFHWIFLEFKSRPLSAKLCFRSCIQDGGGVLYIYLVRWILIKDWVEAYLMNCRYPPLLWRNRPILGLSHCKATV